MSVPSCGLYEELNVSGGTASEFLPHFTVTGGVRELVLNTDSLKPPEISWMRILQSAAPGTSILRRCLCTPPFQIRKWWSAPFSVGKMSNLVQGHQTMDYPSFFMVNILRSGSYHLHLLGMELQFTVKHTLDSLTCFPKQLRFSAVCQTGWNTVYTVYYTLSMSASHQLWI